MIISYLHHFSTFGNPYPCAYSFLNTSKQLFCMNYHLIPNSSFCRLSFCIAFHIFLFCCGSYITSFITFGYILYFCFFNITLFPVRFNIFTSFSLTSLILLIHFLSFTCCSGFLLAIKSFFIYPKHNTISAIFTKNIYCCATELKLFT